MRKFVIVHITSCNTRNDVCNLKVIILNEFKSAPLNQQFH